MSARNERRVKRLFRDYKAKLASHHCDTEHLVEQVEQNYALMQAERRKSEVPALTPEQAAVADRFLNQWEARIKTPTDHWIEEMMAATPARDHSPASVTAPPVKEPLPKPCLEDQIARIPEHRWWRLQQDDLRRQEDERGRELLRMAAADDCRPDAYWSLRRSWGRR